MRKITFIFGLLFLLPVLVLSANSDSHYGSNLCPYDGTQSLGSSSTYQGKTQKWSIIYVSTFGTNLYPNSSSLTIGTSSRQWDAIYVGSITATGDSTYSGDQTITGKFTLTGEFEHDGIRTLTKGVLSNVLFTTNTITVTDNYMLLDASGTLKLESTPSISVLNISTGAVVILTGSSNVVTLQDNDTLAGSKLELGASTRDVGTNDILELLFLGSTWVEIGYTDN